MHQNRWRLGLRPRHLWGADSASPDSLAGFIGAYFKAPTFKGRGGAKMIYAPGARNPQPLLHMQFCRNCYCKNSSSDDKHSIESC